MVEAWIALLNGMRLTPAFPARSSSFARFSTQCVTSVSAGPPLVRVVLEASILRRIVRGRDDDTVGEVFLAAAVINQDRARDDWGRSYAVVLLDDVSTLFAANTSSAVRCAGLGQRVRVLSHVERAVGAMRSPVVADRLSDGQNVRFGESAVQR